MSVAAALRRKKSVGLLRDKQQANLDQRILAILIDYQGKLAVMICINMGLTYMKNLYCKFYKILHHS